MFEGSRLKKQRELLGISQERLAEKVEVHVNTIRRWEQGKQSPDAKKLDRIAEALNTTIAYLSGESGGLLPPDSDEEASSSKKSSGVVKDPTFVSEGNIIGNKNVLVYEDNGLRFIFPATEKNQDWFREVMGSAIAGRAVAHA